MSATRILAIAAAVAAAWPSAAAADTTAFFGTHNVLRGQAAFTPLAGVIGWQEVNDPPDRQKLRRSLPAYRHFIPAGPAGAVPISWRNDRFQAVGSRSLRTHPGEAKVTPARYVNWVRLRVRATGAQFFIVNTHFISGAWNKHPNRQARWRLHARVLRDEVVRLRGAGLPVLVTGDFNRHQPVSIPGVAYAGQRPRVPLDHLYVTQGVRHSAAQRLPKSGSDHFAWRIRVRF